MGRQCQEPEDPTHTLGNKRCLLVDLPKKFSWRDVGMKSSSTGFVGGVRALNTEFEDRVVAQAPYQQWSFSATVNVVQFNRLEDLGDVKQVAGGIEDSQTDKEGRQLQTKVLSASRSKLGIALADTVEFLTETAKGPCHSVSLTSILDGRLYNVIGQAPEDLWPELGSMTSAAVASTRLCSRVSKFYAGFAGGS